MPLFLVDFGAWLSQPSVDFAREVSAESSENKGFRACSDCSLLPKCDSPFFYSIVTSKTLIPSGGTFARKPRGFPSYFIPIFIDSAAAPSNFVSFGFGG